jgi:tRNA(Ile2) C34 agmatinyltransferase TiaS
MGKIEYDFTNIGGIIPHKKQLLVTESSQNTTQIIKKKRKVRLMGNVLYIGEKKSAHRISWET